MTQKAFDEQRVEDLLNLFAQTKNTKLCAATFGCSERTVQAYVAQARVNAEQELADLEEKKAFLEAVASFTAATDDSGKPKPGSVEAIEAALQRKEKSEIKAAAQYILNANLFDIDEAGKARVAQEIEKRYG